MRYDAMQQAAPERAPPVVVLFPKELCLDGSDVDELASFLTDGKEYIAVDEGVERVILAHAYVEAGMVDCAALTLDDVACLGKLTTKNLNTESFAFRLAAVLRTTYTFLMCHF